ncbi:MAG: alpha-L-fucosidase [Bacteroidales bacterium]|jgi:alpha-L-fucosidase
MNKRTFLTAAIIATCLVLNFSASMAQLPKESEDQKTARMKWWTDDRFGMFIHFGLYAQAARHEWVKKNERISEADYLKYFEQFNPDLYNPREWARMAKEAGMKYAVMTTKHHEGFCLFDSKFTDYKATNTPVKKDLIKEYVEAFRAEGLKVGFYYSLLDWHHPDYIIDRNHPQSGKTDAEYDSLNKGRDMAKYRLYLKNQVRELLTNYGKIDIIWLDFSSPTGKYGKTRTDWDSENLLKMVRELQPGIIVNDRLDLEDVPGGWDFKSPEQYKPREWVQVNGKRVPWEVCQTFSGSWGYYRDEMSWKDSKQLIELLIESVSKGGNVLLNVGPTGRGTIDYRAQDRLASMGNWMKYCSRSIYGCTQAPDEFKAPVNSLLTYNPLTTRLYIHLLDWPLNQITLEGYAGKIKYAQFLHDASEIAMTTKKATIWLDEKSKGDETILRLPVLKPDVEIPVIELILK